MYSETRSSIQAPRHLLRWLPWHGELCPNARSAKGRWGRTRRDQNMSLVTLCRSCHRNNQIILSITFGVRLNSVAIQTSTLRQTGERNFLVLSKSESSPLVATTPTTTIAAITAVFVHPKPVSVKFSTRTSRGSALLNSDRTTVGHV